jgi:hypothetical protein
MDAGHGHRDSDGGAPSVESLPDLGDERADVLLCHEERHGFPDFARQAGDWGLLDFGREEQPLGAVADGEALHAGKVESVSASDGLDEPRERFVRDRFPRDELSQGSVLGLVGR